MPEDDLLAEQFESHRAHLRAVATRMLGSPAEADEAVQEAWIRLNRSDSSAVGNLGGWLTTVVARVSLDMLRSRGSRREDPVGSAPDTVPSRGAGADPEAEAVLADAVGAALLIVLDTLSPTERLAFVLHDLFAVPFVDIAAIVGRSPDATKQLASRARSKVQGTGIDGAGVPAERAVVDAFLAAARGGDLEALVRLLHPDVEIHADAVAVRMGSPERTVGALAVAGTFSGRALGAEVVLIDGGVGLAWIVEGRTRVAWEFGVDDGRVAHIEMLAAPTTLADLDLVVGPA